MDGVFIQLVGFIAFLFVVLSFQNKKRKLIVLFLLVGQMLFALHFGLLGAWVASAMNVIAAFRGIVYYHKEQQSWASKPFWPYVFIVVFSLAAVMTWGTWLSILPLLGAIIETVALWLHNPKHIRRLMLMPRPLWLTYNYSVGSYAGLVTEVFIISSLLIAMYRFDWGKPKKN